MVRSCSQPEMIAFNPIVWIRQSRVLYPLRRSPFKSIRMSHKIGLGSGFNDHRVSPIPALIIAPLCLPLIEPKGCRNRCYKKLIGERFTSLT